MRTMTGWVAVLAGLLSACGETNDNGDAGGQAGSSSQGGSAGQGGDAAQGGSTVQGGSAVQSGSAAGSGGAKPAAQGAVAISLAAPTPLPAGKQCPIGGAFATAIPSNMGPDEVTYLHHVVDGEAGASVACRVAGSSSFELSGSVALAGTALIIEDGVVSADGTGTATIKVVASSRLASSLTGMNCTIDAAKGPTDQFQIKPGSVWASFTCPAVVSPPSDSCEASGYFVLENCEQ